MTDLSVIIVSYNTKKYTVDCINSVLDEKGDIKVEIVVVDNASSDGSIEELERLVKLKNIILIRNKNNTGFSYANNQGISVARGTYILLLNSDTHVEEGAFEEMMDFVTKTANVGVVGLKLLDEDGSTQDSVYHFPTVLRAIKSYWMGMDNVYGGYSPKSRKPLEVEAVFGTALLITPKALEKVGNLDERYHFYYEDIDYCKRVKNKGLKVYFLPSAKIIHYCGLSGKDIAKPEMQWRRLIPSSKIYHGLLKHYLIYLISLSGQKMGLGKKWEE